MKLKLISVILACIQATSLATANSVQAILSEQDQALIKAINKKNAEQVKQALKQGASPNVAVNDDGDTSLMLTLRSMGSLVESDDFRFYGEIIAPPILFVLILVLTIESNFHGAIVLGANGLSFLFAIWAHIRYIDTNIRTHAKLTQLFEIVELLVKHQATDLTIKNKEGETIYDIASEIKRYGNNIWNSQLYTGLKNFKKQLSEKKVQK